MNKYLSADKKTCVSKCGDYATVDLIANTCNACSVNVTSCSACYLENSVVKCTKCTYGYLTATATCSESCASPYIKLISSLNNEAGNICTKICPSGTIYTSSSNSCEKCHINCKTCSKVNDNTACLECIDTLYKCGIYCVTCPEKYYWDNDFKLCVANC